MITNFAEKQAELKKRELEEEIEQYELFIEALRTPCTLNIELEDCGISIGKITDIDGADEDRIKEILIAYCEEVIDEIRKENVNVNTFPKG